MDHPTEVPPSILALYWRGDEAPLEFEVAGRLESAGYERIDVRFEVARDVLWAFAVERSAPDVDAGGGRTTYLLWVEERPDEDDPLLYSRARWGDEEDARAVQEARWILYVETQLDRDEPLPDYQRQLQLAAALGDDLVVACLDVSSFTIRSALTLRELAASPAAPRPDSLYATHFVVGPSGEAWLHTHGLGRAGCPELDVLGIDREQAGLAGEVLQAVAAQILEHGCAEDGDEHEFGHELRVALVPWRRAVEDFPPGCLGGADDRDDDFHGGLRLAIGEVPPPGETGFRPLRETLEAMADNPILHVTLAETRRMEILARERWAQAAMAWFSLPPGDRRLLVKLGYQVDGSEENEREHLWFEVERIGRGDVEARLLNQPYRIARLSADDVGRHEITHLTDFTLYTTHGTYTPETIGECGNVAVWTDPSRGIRRQAAQEESGSA